MKQKNVIFLTAMIILSSLAVFAGSELTDNRWLLDNETAVTDYYLNISDGVTTKLVVNPDGSVRIGSSISTIASTMLITEGKVDSDWLAQILNQDADNGFGLLVQAGSDSNDKILALRQQNGAEILTVLGNGNVGINTTNPTSLLETGSAAGTNEVNLSGIMYVNSTSGSVGIGTTSPLGKLDVSGGVSTFAYIGGDATQRTVRIGDDSSGYATIQGWGKADSLVRDLSLQASGGNVGIGTTGPNATLNVFGDTLITNPSDSNDYINLSSSGTVAYFDSYAGSAAAGAIQFRVNDALTNAIRITSGGNVGIGTTDPGAKLSMVPAGTTGSSNEAIRFNRVEDGLRYNSIYTIIPAGADIGTMSFLIHDSVTTTSQAEVMTLKGSGNVGIGTTTPSAKLHVESGDVQFNGTGNAIGFYFNQTTGNIGFGMTDPNSPLVGETQILKIGGSAVPALGFQSSSSSHEAAITIDGSGMYLESGGHATGAGNNFIKFRTADGNNDLSADDRMMIDNKGSVGVNTTSPTQLLDVHGDVNISSETNPRLNFAGGGYIYDNGTAVIIGHE